MGAGLHSGQLSRVDEKAARKIYSVRANSKTIWKDHRKISVTRKPHRQHEGPFGHVPAARLQDRLAQRTRPAGHAGGGAGEIVCFRVLGRQLPRRDPDLRRIRLHGRATNRAGTPGCHRKHVVLGDYRDPKEPYRQMSGTLSAVIPSGRAPVLESQLEHSRRDLRQFAVLVIQLALLLLAFDLYGLESRTLFTLGCLVFGGFAVSYWLPFRLKEPFFIVLSLAGAYFLLDV